MCRLLRMQILPAHHAPANNEEMNVHQPAGCNPSA
jgi:hypothetical protein